MVSECDTGQTLRKSGFSAFQSRPRLRAQRELDRGHRFVQESAHPGSKLRAGQEGARTVGQLAELSRLRYEPKDYPGRHYRSFLLHQSPGRVTPTGILQMVTAAMKLKDAYSLEGKL